MSPLFKGVPEGQGIWKQEYNISNKKGTQMIEKTTKIGELLEMAPEKAEILLSAGMHCLGCPASSAETIEEACEVHGIDVENLLEKLNS